jgi:rhodanese-related sulfurtransferase
MQRYDDLIADALLRVREIMPWDLRGRLALGTPPLLLDVREPAEFARCRIAGSLNVPRGVLEQSCEWDYEETVPELARGREQEIIVICRSGRRSVLAADTLLSMGFSNVVSLKTGITGWKDFEQTMVNENGETIDADAGDALLAQHLRPEQQKPKSR